MLFRGDGASTKPSTLAMPPPCGLTIAISVGNRWRLSMNIVQSFLHVRRKLSERGRDPHEVHRNKLDARMAILYREQESGYWLRLPVWMSNREDRHNSLLSARFAKQAEVYAGRISGRRLWRKG